MTEPPFSLRTLIICTLAETSATDPRDIAVRVVKHIPPERIGHVLVESLVAEVRGVMGAQRNAALSKALAPGYRSPKVAGIRNHWAEMCAARIHVGRGEWKSLARCDNDDLAYAERERRADAEREVRRADMYGRLRHLLQRHGVRTVGDLPVDAAQELAA